jgi:hypothetical protein
MGRGLGRERMAKAAGAGGLMKWEFSGEWEVPSAIGATAASPVRNASDRL